MYQQPDYFCPSLHERTTSCTRKYIYFDFYLSTYSVAAIQSFILSINRIPAIYNPYAM
ncbi:hypothetical protein GYMLUDRAFT_48267 [Collybiopsis luxurians FD-317 M1]|uniref:Uncharacterized protein n=1 Tax=Collybiopsis luxurians FD-317 M1 TaxID=944289 RepID=A0A0D0BJF6_9AGAR|nr:hypothetical protein GYMLUDRAFT_48267 [Collybiopsis luxurians FD-317 M1]